MTRHLLTGPELDRDELLDCCMCALAYHGSVVDRPKNERNPRDAQMEAEQRRDVAARRAAVRRAHARGPGANIEETIRMIRAGDVLHGVARR